MQTLYTKTGSLSKLDKTEEEIIKENLVGEKLRYKDLSEDQKLAYDYLFKWLNTNSKVTEYITLGGLAGSGKTTLISVIADDLISQGRLVNFIALTGKAVNVLRSKLMAHGLESSKIEARTVHSFIYSPIEEKGTGRIEKWMRKENAGESNLIVFVDEASMIDEIIFNDLKKAVEQFKNVKFIFVGDHGQLPPIKGKLNLMADPKIKLEKIHRQAENSPIIILAHHARNGERIKLSMECDQIKFKKTSDISELYSLEDKSNFDKVCLSALNVRRTRINGVLKNFFNPNSYHLVNKDDIVICLRNANAEIDAIKTGKITDLFRVVNGMRGIVKTNFDYSEELIASNLEIFFPEERYYYNGLVNIKQFLRHKTFDAYIDIDPLATSWDQVGELYDFGWSMTCHKAQGSQFKDVIIDYYRPKMFNNDLWNRWLYTAITRAVDSVTLMY